MNMLISKMVLNMQYEVLNHLEIWMNKKLKNKRTFEENWSMYQELKKMCSQDFRTLNK